MPPALCLMVDDRPVVARKRKLEWLVAPAAARPAVARAFQGNVEPGFPEKTNVNKGHERLEESGERPVSRTPPGLHA